MAVTSPSFVDWREEFISQERGSRVVHYYLEDSLGASYLAVVGTERSLRHMLYVVSEDFARAYVSNSSGLSCLKWRSRREVVHWLASFLPKRLASRDQPCPSKSDIAHTFADGTMSNGLLDSDSDLLKHQDVNGRSLTSQTLNIAWSGVPWTCSKQLKHYQAFCRNGVTIAAHSFVLVMSEEGHHYLAYLEDMYEDKKGLKKVKVRWFHQNQEFACPIPPPSPHPNEVFITPNSQVISAECVDDLATVLTPEHYEKCLTTLPDDSLAGVCLCFRQYSKNRFKSFDLSTLRGYFEQPVLSVFDNCTVSGAEREEHGFWSTIRRGGPKRITCVKGRNIFLADHFVKRISSRANHIKAYRPSHMNSRNGLHARKPLVKFIGPRLGLSPPFRIEEKIELLCQDSGIRGCWFKCRVIHLSEKRLKVRYDDVENDDGSGNLEEWVPAFRPAAPDKLGMRCVDRLTVRPRPPYNRLPAGFNCQSGTPVDVWWSDGWWEGVVIGSESFGSDMIQVYFPGEDLFVPCERKRLRISRDWVGGQWVDINARPDILSTIYAASNGVKSSTCSIFAKGAESGGSGMSDHELIPAQANSHGENKQVVASLRCGSDESPESIEQENLKKRQRDEHAEECCDGEETGDGCNS